jgi:dTDP-glucose 4,6-dehydratase
MNSVLITGGAGFIGSNFARHWRHAYPQDSIVVLDALTYAGNPANLAMFAGDANFRLVKGDICDEDVVAGLFDQYVFRNVVHLAAESHVDRSIVGPDAFIQTNVIGTHVLLKAARSKWGGGDGYRFHHVSTDEVYGSLEAEQAPFHENSPYDPRSPYAASKAASDFLVRAYSHTYGVPVTISNSSNNYGPYQFPEKLIPLMIINALRGRPLPVYGDGGNIRDWLHVDDHCRAVLRVIEHGRIGQSYNVGGNKEIRNIDLVRQVCGLIDETFAAQPHLAGRFPECPAASAAHSRELITFVRDRPGHDRRYGLETRKIAADLDFRPSRSLEAGLRDTLAWYLENEGWWQAIERGEYRDWIAAQYGTVAEVPVRNPSG